MRSDSRGEDGNGLASDEKLASNKSASDNILALAQSSAHRRGGDRALAAEPARNYTITMD
jgi:hypothetical protein